MFSPLRIPHALTYSLPTHVGAAQWGFLFVLSCWPVVRAHSERKGKAGQQGLFGVCDG